MPLRGYGTPTEIAQLCGYDTTDAALLAEIELVMEPIELEVEQYCETTFFDEAAATKVYSGNGTRMIVLGYYLRSLDEVWILDAEGNQDEDITDEVVLMPDAPRVGAYRWIERRATNDFSGQVVNNFPSGLANIEITGDWGFEECPAPIKLAVALSVKHFFQMRNYDATKTQESSINRTVEFTRGDRVHFLHPVAKQILDKWTNSRRMSE
jgi:hypothetical protein